MYQLLTKSKTPNISQLAQDLAVHREKIYQALDFLQTLGLVYKSKDYSREIEIISPSQILTLLKVKRGKTDRLSEDLSKVLPDLLIGFENQRRSPTLKLYEGTEQFMGVYDQFILEAKDEILCYVHPDYFLGIVDKDYLKYWSKRRIAKNIQIRMLIPEGAKMNFETDPFFNSSPILYREIRYFKAVTEFKGTYYICGSRIVVFNPILPKAVSIADKIIVDTFRSQFEQIWEGLE